MCWGKCASFCIFVLIARARGAWGDAGGPAAPCRAPAVLLHVPSRSVYTTLTCWVARLSALSRRSWRLRSPDPAAAHGSHPRGAASGRLPPGPGAPDRNGCGRCLAQSRPTAVSRVPPSHSTHRSASGRRYPKTTPKRAVSGRFVPLETTHHYQIFKSICLRFFQPAAAVPSGPKRALKMGISGYFWAFLGISGIGIKWCNKPPPPLFRRSATWDSGARRPPAGRPELLNYEIA